MKMGKNTKMGYALSDHATTLEWCDSLPIIFYALCVLNNTMCASWWPPRYCSPRETAMTKYLATGLGSGATVDGCRKHESPIRWKYNFETGIVSNEDGEEYKRGARCPWAGCAVDP